MKERGNTTIVYIALQQGAKQKKKTKKKPTKETNKQANKQTKNTPQI